MMTVSLVGSAIDVMTLLKDVLVYFGTLGDILFQFPIFPYILSSLATFVVVKILLEVL